MTVDSTGQGDGSVPLSPQKADSLIGKRGKVEEDSVLRAPYFRQVSVSLPEPLTL